MSACIRAPDAVFAISVADLGEALAARQDSVTHALVEPVVTTELHSFITALYATRTRWIHIA